METIIEWRDIYGVTTLVLAASLLVGGLFGWLAERSDYCARSAFDEIFSLTSRQGRGQLNQLWQVAIAGISAIIAILVARQLGLIDIESARQFKAPLNLVGLFLGTLLFGIGMGLSRGCVSRLIILSGRGNIRALITLVFLSLFAWSAISGVLAVPRITLASLGQIEHSAALSHSLFAIWVLLLLVAVMLVMWRGGADQPVKRALMAASIGLLVPACFFVTAVIGADEFDPVPVEALRFILPVADSLGYFVYSTALTPKFGLGLVGGAFIGTILSAKLSGRIVIEGFNNAPHPLRYILGAFFLAFGGVIAGGCTVGWLLTGGSVLNGGVLIAFIGFGLGNLSLRLPFINGFLNGETATASV
ncbi:YeeE/YedE family protein [Alphaproteobacteria bacterium]|nr:YeeE/YedE family protein [Alphaproteobacteria bacterium]